MENPVSKILALHFALLLFGVLVVPAFASGPGVLQIEEAEWDIGTVKEEDGILEHTIFFKNAGNDPLVIENVVSDCNCAAASYTKSAVEPGGRGEIRLTFDPSKRYGPFRRKIRVSALAGGNRHIATIPVFGEVLPREKAPSESHIFRTGSGLNLSSISALFGTVAQGEESSASIGIYNSTDRTLPVYFACDPRYDFISVDAPYVLEPGTADRVVIRCSVPEGGYYGPFAFRVVPFAGGVKQEPVINAVGTVTENFSGADTVNRPVAVLETKYLDFGVVDIRRTYSASVELKNEGSRRLIVRRITGNDIIRARLPDGTVIRPGSSAFVTVTLDARSIDRLPAGDIIAVVTNDPLNPVQYIRVAARRE
ncbi:MAG: DUF1573 domain-containing protein [Rikenellaceae bacterium]|nr:DUF1573 domain-containing protein [Rikenellaceae bacterium]